MKPTARGPRASFCGERASEALDAAARSAPVGGGGIVASGLPRSAHGLAVHISPGVEIKRIILGRNDSSLSDLDGHCEWQARSGAPDISDATRLFVSLCGPEADAYFFRRKPTLNGDMDIARRAAGTIAFATGVHVEEVLSQGRLRAGVMVRIHREPIQALARALLQARWFELSGREATRILERSGVGCHGSAREPSGYHPAETSHQSGYVLFGFERRGGRTVPSANPDPRRQTSVIEWRSDGYVIGSILARR